MQVVCQGASAEDALWGKGLPLGEDGGLPSGVIVRDAAQNAVDRADLGKAFQFAGLYCHYSGGTAVNGGGGFDDCPNVHVYDGNANFDTASANVRTIGGRQINAHELTIRFAVAFDSDPVCTVMFENVWVHHKVHTDARSIRISIADHDEQEVPWATVNSWMQVTCYGLSAASGVYMAATPPTFGQLSSGVVVPNARADLGVPYAFSALYCNWNGNGMRCDNLGGSRHAWGGLANFQATATASGNALEVLFTAEYAGDPFCRVSFEDVWLHHRQDTYPDGLTIFIADSNGNDVDWSTQSTDLQIICHGTSPA